MKQLRILILFVIVATGGFLYLTNDSAPTPGQQDAQLLAEGEGENGEGAAVDTTPKTGLALALMKIRNAFTGKGKVTSDVQTAQRDLGRLQNHFRTAPDE